MSATNPHVPTARDTELFINVSIFLSSLQSVITSRNKILVYFTQIQTFATSPATHTSPHACFKHPHPPLSLPLYATGQHLSFRGPETQNLHALPLHLPLNPISLFQFTVCVCACLCVGYRCMCVYSCVPMCVDAFFMCVDDIFRCHSTGL